MTYHVYYTMLENEEYKKVESLDENVVATVIYDSIVDSDIPIDILGAYKPEPCGYFPNPYEWASKLYNAAHKYIDTHVEDNQIYAYAIDEHGQEVLSQKFDVSIDLKKILHDIIQDRSECEQSYIDTGECILRMLKDFVEQGKWQYGLIAPDKTIMQDSTSWPKPIIENHRVIWKDETGLYEPIIWFGMEGKRSDYCWTLSRATTLNETEDEMWKWFWFCDFWTYAWDVLFAGDGENFTTWMFAECAMDEPPIEPVRLSCPVLLDEEDDSEALLIKIEQFLFQKSEVC